MAAKKTKKPAGIKRTSPAVAAAPKPMATGAFSKLLQEHLAKVHEGQVSAGSGVRVRLQGILSTRCETLDAATGRGGIPFGRITVLTGDEACGKTTAALHLVAEVQSIGGIALYLDLEHKLDVDYAQALGVDLDQMIMSQPGTGEEAFSIAEGLLDRVRSEPGHQDVPILIIVDSLNAMTPKSMIEGGYDDAFVAAPARLFSGALPKITKKLSGLKVALVMISQIRDKIVKGGSYREKITGGRAVKFYTALAIEFFRKEWLKEGEREIGSVIDARCIKNQISKPFGKARFNIVWGTGIDYAHSLFARAADLGEMNIGAGGWYEVTHPNTGEVFKWQGMGKAYARLMAKPETSGPMNQIITDLKQKVRGRFA